MKRGQAAVEFLMTYGWVLLVILLAVMALAYFGILSPGDQLPETCLFFPGLGCDSFRVNEDGVALYISNGGGRDYINVSITVLGEGPCEGDSSEVQDLKDGHKKEFFINCTVKPSSGSAFRRSIQINYTELEGLSHSKEGQLTTKVE